MHARNKVYRRADGSEPWNYESLESKVVALVKFSGREGGEIYKWFAQLRLVFRGKPRTYRRDEDKIAYALSYSTSMAQNW